MKDLLRHFVLFAVLTIAFSSLLSCSTNNQDADNIPLGANASNTASPEGNQADTASKQQAEKPQGKSADYPPLPSAIAQSDLKNLDGTTFKVADRKGKVLLLNMWATWCGPCRAEMPALVGMHDQYRGQFEVLGLNVDDEPKPMIDKFAEEMNLNYPLVWADSTLQNELVKLSKFGGIPQSFLVDRNGHLRAVFRGGSKNEIEKMREVVAAVVAE